MKRKERMGREKSEKKLNERENRIKMRKTNRIKSMTVCLMHVLNGCITGT